MIENAPQSSAKIELVPTEGVEPTHSCEYQILSQKSDAAQPLESMVL
jgi:hypothetical protein